MAHNRYLELTDTQKVHVDRYINSIASGGATEITLDVNSWVIDARKAVTGLERQSDSVHFLAEDIGVGWCRTDAHRKEGTDDELYASIPEKARVLSQRVAPAMQKNCSTVRHALAMIVDATVRPTLDD